MRLAINLVFGTFSALSVPLRLSITLLRLCFEFTRGAKLFTERKVLVLQILRCRLHALACLRRPALALPATLCFRLFRIHALDALYLQLVAHFLKICF